MGVDERAASGLDACATPDPQEPGCEDPIRERPEELRHVRSLDRDLQFAIVDGLTRSQTMRDLITAINASNVIAYIGRGKCAYPEIACLALLSGRSPMRYVRINVQLPGVRGSPTVWGRSLVPIVGHELQHVVEIAADATIVDERSLKSGRRTF
jgi:hypothetical protein